MNNKSYLMNKYASYRYALSLTSQFYFCGLPFRLDTTPKCTLNCLYCFAMSRGGRRSSNKLIADFDQLERKFHRALQSGAENLDVNGEMLARKVPIHFGGISDPFSNKIVSTVSKELLNLLSMYDYPVVISTKNTRELLKDETLGLLKKIKYLAIQISITTSSEELAARVEPNAPSPKERIKCIQTLSDEGIYVICRLQPLFFCWIDEIANELIPMLGLAKCKHVTVEYLKLPVERHTSLFGDMFRAIEWDGYEFYKKNGALLVGREWILPNEFKWENLQPLISAIHQYGMAYGAGDYGLNHLGDTDCCCGIDRLEGFSNWFQGNFANVIRNSRSDCIKFDEVTKHWFPKKSIQMVINSNCRLAGDSHSVLDYLKDKWNRPGTANAPDAFLGISWQGDYDEDGNCIYLKEKGP